MKRTILFLAFAMGLTLSASAQKQECYRIVSDTYEGLGLEFTFDAPAVGETEVCGQRFSTLTVDGLMPWGKDGAPALPTFSKLIEVPLCEDFVVTVRGLEFDTLQLAGPVLAPMQPSRSKSDTSAPKLSYIRGIYETDMFFGNTVPEVEAVGIARDRRLARLRFTPVSYNPVSGQVAIVRRAEVTVSYRGVDSVGTQEMFRRYYSPLFNSGASSINALYPKSVSTTAPVRYLIVANSMFRGHMDSFVQWKKRKGFITDIVYTDDAAVGSTTTSIQTYIKSQYTNATAANPAPTYVLLVGDVDQLPAFSGTTASDHITDLYYMTWTTGDNLPDCHYGRFSAQNVSQLTPQVQKTLMYEQYTFADPSFLDRAVMVAGVDGGSSGDFGYTHADPAMDYAITNYVNGAHGYSEVRYFKNNTSIVPAGVTNVHVASSANSMSATVRSYYNQGAGLINYSAHGSSTSWGTPNFTTTHVSSMTNTQKFGLMIGNCCLTNKFEVSSCFGESLLRKGNYCGAVGYIGGSNSTYWYEDFYWAVGIRTSIGPNMSMAYNGANLGIYDRAFHTHGETYANWAITQGAIMMQGNMAVEASSSSRNNYYWEIYHLMGDPSVMTYLTQAAVMPLTVSSMISYGTASLTVSTAPYAYVAMTDTLTRTLVAAAWANASGVATLTLPGSMLVGGYEVASTAQGYQPGFQSVSVITPSGPFPYVSSIEATAPLVAGDTVALAVTVKNGGNVTSHNIVATLTSSSPMLTLPVATLTIDSLAPNAQRVFTVQAVVDPAAVDQTVVSINSSVDWTGSTTPALAVQLLTIVAPKLVFTISDPTPSILPNGTLTLTATLSNQGHAALQPYRFEVASPTSMLTVSSATATAMALAVGGQRSFTFGLQANAQLPQGIDVPLALTMATAAGPVLSQTLPVYVGNSYRETFEGNQTHLDGWTYGAVQWVVYDTGAYEGSYCAGSSYTMSHNMTSEMNIGCTLTAADSISFYYKVSSETNYDKFHFFIDGTEMLVSSGDVAWTRAAYPVAAGTHTFSFTYTKDNSVSSGSDRAWVDNVALPHSAQLAAFRSDTVCVGQSYSVGNQTINTSAPGTGSAIATLTDGTMLLVDYTIVGTMREDVYDTACSSYTWFGNTYTASTEATHTISSAGACDSVITLHLTILGTVDNVETVQACDSIYWNGEVLTESGSYTDTIHGADGCDTVAGLQLTVNHSAYDTVYIHTESMNFVWFDSSYTATGIYHHVVPTVAGCDSTLTLILTFGDDPVPGTEGIDDLETAGLTLYPNPTAGWLSLGVAVSEVVVYDMLGHELLRRSDVSTLDLSALPQGVYMLRLTLPGATATRRVVKQ